MYRKSICTLMSVTIVAFSGVVVAQPPAVPKPTKHHKVLAKEVGVWDAECKTWLEGPDGPVMKSKAVETNRMLDNGMWLISDFKGEFGGQPFEGHGQFGYDAEKGKYIGTWVDSMSPALATMEGSYDAESGTLTMISESVGPDGKITKNRSVSRFTDDDTRLFIVFMQPPGSDDHVKMMEFIYKRRK